MIIQDRFSIADLGHDRLEMVGFHGLLALEQSFVPKTNVARFLVNVCRDVLFISSIPMRTESGQTPAKRSKPKKKLTAAQIEKLKEHRRIKSKEYRQRMRQNRVQVARGDLDRTCAVSAS